MEAREFLLTALFGCFAASLLLGTCTYLLMSIHVGHKSGREKIGIAFKVFFRSFVSFICCFWPVIAYCCYSYIIRKRRYFPQTNVIIYFFGETSTISSTF